MGGQSGGADDGAEPVVPCAFGKTRCGVGGPVGAEDVGLPGNFQLLELGAGGLDHRPVGVGAEDDGYFFHGNYSFFMAHD